MLRVLPVLFGLLAASNATAQVFFPQSAPAGYPVGDNLDLTLEIEGFTTNWGEGYTGVSVGAGLDLELSPSLTIASL